MFFNVHIATLLLLSSSLIFVCCRSCLFGKQFVFHTCNLQHQILLHSKTRPAFNKKNNCLPHVIDCCVVVANDASLSSCCFSIFLGKKKILVQNARCFLCCMTHCGECLGPLFTIVLGSINKIGDRCWIANLKGYPTAISDFDEQTHSHS